MLRPSVVRTTAAARIAILAAALCLVAFVLQELPSATAPRPWSLGSDGDTWFHVAIQIELAHPGTFARDPELSGFYVQSRPAFETLLHRAVIWTSDHLFGDNLLAANLAGWWLNELAFVLGCIWLALRWSRDLAVAALFGLCAVGLSRAVLAWWGMPFGGVIPHDVGLMLVPWFVGAYVGAPAGQRTALFFLLGIAVNVYPLQPAYLALLLGFITLLCDRPFAVVRDMTAFLLGAAPTVASSAIRTLNAASDSSSIAQAVVQEFYPYLFPRSLRNIARWMATSAIWGFLLLGRALLTRAPCGDHCARRTALDWFAVGAIALTLFGLVSGKLSHGLALFLFHRASALLYLPAYLWCGTAAVQWWRTGVLPFRLAAVFLGFAMLLNAWWFTPVVRFLVEGRPLQLSSPYFDLADWARQSPPGTRFLVPYNGRTTYFAFRVYAQRPTFLHSAVGETALTAPSTAATFRTMADDVRRVYEPNTPPADVRDILNKYDVGYVIADRAVPSLAFLHEAYRNAEFVVYAASVDRSKPALSRR